MLTLAANLAVAALIAATPPTGLDKTITTRLDPSLRCRLGAYAFPDGRFLSITGSDGDPRNLRYGRSEGGLGKLVEQVDGAYATSTSPRLTLRFEPCESGRVHMETGSGMQLGRRAPLVVRETTFHSAGIALHGKLVLPPGGEARTKAVAVWIGGSNNDPDTDDASWQFELARRGVGFFVYDKRGTGASGGDLTADFHVRAADTAAAVQEARRLAPHVQKFGVIGASQGGWVAPLVATLTPLDFVVPAFAMAEGPPAQDRAVVESQLRRAGFGDVALSQAREVTAATEQVVRSNFSQGFEALDALKSKYREEPWLAAIQPRSYTGILLRMPTAEVRQFGPTLSQGLTFNYEPRPIIETIKSRQLWLLGGQDPQTPSAGTIQVLQDIQRSRADLDLIVFPRADHGLLEKFQGPTGETAAYPPGLFDLLASWILTGSPAPLNAQAVIQRGADR
ncbi:alpha/beta hydrolase family protein [Caulobacter sp. ErkDOM-E]|uniref:alpha/beta hydrolase family protein n=1 Tax=Caulobacter sp. ErkDOM-E TaxID=3402778 RepID=UPI003AF5CE4A